MFYIRNITYISRISKTLLQLAQFKCTKDTQHNYTFNNGKYKQIKKNPRVRFDAPKQENRDYLGFDIAYHLSH